MKELLISQIAPILDTAFIAILVVVIKTIAAPIIEVAVKKKEQIERAIISSGHEQDLQTAKEVWNIIEEKFRITENAKEVLGTKADEFDNLLLQRIPGLTQQNLDDLRQAIAGEFNKGKEAISNEQADMLAQIATLQKDKADLQNENNSLKTTITQITQLGNSIAPTQTDIQQ